jgi:hypothetical protein
MPQSPQRCSALLQAGRPLKSHSTARCFPNRAARSSTCGAARRGARRAAGAIGPYPARTLHYPTTLWARRAPGAPLGGDEAVVGVVDHLALPERDHRALGVRHVLRPHAARHPAARAVQLLRGASRQPPSQRCLAASALPCDIDACERTGRRSSSCAARPRLSAGRATPPAAPAPVTHAVQYQDASPGPAPARRGRSRRPRRRRCLQRRRLLQDWSPPGGRPQFCFCARRQLCSEPRRLPARACRRDSGRQAGPAKPHITCNLRLPSRSTLELLLTSPNCVSQNNSRQVVLLAQVLPQPSTNTHTLPAGP